MKDKVYIVVNSRGATKMSKKIPSLNRGEIFIEIDLTVDNSLFMAMMPKANIEIQEDKNSKPIQAKVVMQGPRRIGLEI
jgi:hypothetical protein